MWAREKGWAGDREESKQRRWRERRKKVNWRGGVKGSRRVMGEGGRFLAFRRCLPNSINEANRINGRAYARRIREGWSATWAERGRPAPSRVPPLPLAASRPSHAYVPRSERRLGLPNTSVKIISSSPSLLANRAQALYSYRVRLHRTPHSIVAPVGLPTATRLYILPVPPRPSLCIVV